MKIKPRFDDINLTIETLLNISELYQKKQPKKSWGSWLASQVCAPNPIHTIYMKLCHDIGTLMQPILKYTTQMSPTTKKQLSVAIPERMMNFDEEKKSSERSLNVHLRLYLECYDYETKKTYSLNEMMTGLCLYLLIKIKYSEYPNQPDLLFSQKAPPYGNSALYMALLDELIFLDHSRDLDISLLDGLPTEDTKNPTQEQIDLEHALLENTITQQELTGLIDLLHSFELLLRRLGEIKKVKPAFFYQYEKALLIQDGSESLIDDVKRIKLSLISLMDCIPADREILVIRLPKIKPQDIVLHPQKAPVL
jgi:hypothetical protein